MRTFLLLALGLAVVAALPRSQQRIVGGSPATISQYPQVVSLLYSSNLSTYSQRCAGILLNTRAILTCAQCLRGDTVNRWRTRVGSASANSGGVVHNTQSFVIHPTYSVAAKHDGDLAILRTTTVITYVNAAVQPATIAGANYNVADNTVVWTAGWGHTSFNGSPSETLQHVQIWTVNTNTCDNRYREIGYIITANMMCAGWLDVGGRDLCEGDEGGPLIHDGNVVVGISSWSQTCALARYPGVYTRISRYSAWITQNA